MIRNNICKILGGFLISVLVNGSVQAACKPSDFKTEKFGSLSDIQKLATLDSMSSEAWETLKKKSGGSVGIGGFSMGGSHGEMKTSVAKIKSLSKIDKYSAYQKSWSESSLSGNDLQAYLACLRNQTGFHLVAESVDRETVKIRFIWIPGGNAGIPKIEAHRNITDKSLKEFKDKLGSEPLGQNFITREGFSDRKVSNRRSRIEIGLDGKSIRVC